MRNLLHDISFYIMYGAAALAMFVIIERMIFFIFNARRAQAVALQAAQGPGEALNKVLVKDASGQEHQAHSA